MSNKCTDQPPSAIYRDTPPESVLHLLRRRRAAAVSSPPPPALQKECVELHGTARRDRSRAAVIIKQKTMVDADNKEGVRAPMRVPVGARRSGVADGYGQDQAAREKDRDARV